MVKINIIAVLIYFILLGYSVYNYKKFNDGRLELANVEVQNQRLVIAEYQRYYEACLSNLNDMERSCHK